MSATLISLSFVLATIAAIAFLTLAVSRLARGTGLPHGPYLFALTATLIWTIAIVGLGPMSVGALAAEAMRNIGWLWLMAAIAGRRPGGRMAAVGAIYFGLFGLQIALAMLLGLLIVVAPDAQSMRGLRDVGHIIAALQMLFAAGALVLLHNLVDAARVEERRALTLPLAALAGMWAFDLNLSAIGALSGEPAQLLIAARPGVQCVVALLLGLAALRPAGQAVRLSRPVALRSMAVIGVAAWLGMLALASTAVSRAGGNFAVAAQFLVLMLAGALLAGFFLSRRVRLVARVWAAKHFFEHRYDYRAEWLRFTATLNRPEAGGSSLGARVVKALADMVDSGGGGLFIAGALGAPEISAAWPKGIVTSPAQADLAALARWGAQHGRIIQFDEVRAGTAPAQEAAATPGWIVDDHSIWIAIPLLHLDTLEGLVLLTRPPVNRALDWEDFDLLKVAGSQAASHLAEARGAEALSESVRFDEFHRRFAFMMHDVKNLTSQMALLARNVERHGDNPDFRVDMVATLQLSASRLGQMMQRLSQQERVRIERLTAVSVIGVAQAVARAKAPLLAVHVTGDAASLALADAETLEQILVHLVQNGIDATVAADRHSPVTIDIAETADQILIVVADHGIGMSPEFVHSRLFRPFSSTKDGGFGIGVYQARQLAMAMHGSLTVDSREGEGSRFILSLPTAATAMPDTFPASEAA